MSAPQQRGLLAAVSFLLLATAIGCAPKAEPTEPEPGAGKLTVTSPAFDNGAPMPVKYTGDGDDVSPPIAWTRPPDGTLSVALICDDPDAPAGTWVHWVVYNIPPTETSLAEAQPEADKLPNGAMHGLNDFGRPGYGGPAPPSGKVHHYRFRVYALDAVMILKPRARRDELDKAMKGHVLASGELVGTYKR